MTTRRKRACLLRATLSVQRLPDGLSVHAGLRQADVGECLLELLDGRYVLSHHLQPIGSRVLVSACVVEAEEVERSGLRRVPECDVILAANPVAVVRPPKLQRRKEKRNSLPPSERARLDRFLSDQVPSRVNIAAALALYTGMRLEEIAALQWEDVDLEADIIFIHKAIGTAAGGGYIKDAKTTGSERKVPISGKLHGMLSEWRNITEREWRDATQLDGSTEQLPGSLYVVGLFGDGTGDYISTGNLGKLFAGLSDALSLTGTLGKRATFKDLRHTFATTALAEGRDVLSIAAVLGHASAKMTLDVYGEAEERSKRKTVEAVASSMSA